MTEDDRLMGVGWSAICRAQQKKGRLNESVDLSRSGDYGADPLGDGTFRMVPSGDVVDFEERCRRLKK